MGGDKGKTNLEMAEALEEMDKDLSSENADFLQEVLEKLGEGEVLRPKEEAKLELLYNRYLGDGEEEEQSEDPDEPPEEDFV